MNNFSYRDKFITERNAPIMGEKTYLTKLRYYSDGGSSKVMITPVLSVSKECLRHKLPTETVRDLGSLFAGQQLNQSSNG